MQVVTTKEELIASLQPFHTADETIGLVPTMGALHQGHISLITASVKQNDRTVMSLFVNPTQFGPNEDLDAYPRTVEADCAIAKSEGVDLVFLGTADDLYPAGYATYLNQERLPDRLCGAQRPTHFRGVLTIVLKLFNLVRPKNAYFGQKDAQQVAVIRRMARDLDTGVTVQVLPIIREADGLAMSSRNVHLSAPQRAAAPVIYHALSEAADTVRGGQREPGPILEQVRARIEAEPLARIDYLELVDGEEIAPLSQIESQALLATAVQIGDTRLIDNIILSLS